MKLKVENDTLVRDTSSNAILETDVSKLNKYRAIKQSLKNKDQKIDNLLERINKLEAMMERITNGELDTKIS